ncbi:GntR family transcriptional regulator [Celeribacter indicus]|uniref:Transcriptional regulator n=1 Tax=Celeribacter indicus TaxID=1208324 RepID=A0A0B5DUN3_9RHOB|nr:GntR family transcriptional regulator [Celeribacter indicus]AJE46734.1 transcriptional regulator [Celeribacter indicus]SDX05115.1 DNA-binding transcriptional regulator, GntR family [Celeribacter indicus]
MKQVDFANDPLQQPAKTVTESVYRKLRSDIIWGRLPPGAPLKSDELRKRYGAGISPLREALSRLTSEKLAISSGQRGFRVAGIGAENIVDVMETRIIIESAALRRSIEIGDVNWEMRVVATHHALSRFSFPTSHGEEAGAWTAQHKAFHMALLSACQSEWQIYLADLLFDQAERFRILRAIKTIATESDRDPLLEHQRILEAVLDRDADASVAALSDHYRATKCMALEVIRAQKDGADG